MHCIIPGSSTYKFCIPSPCIEIHPLKFKFPSIHLQNQKFAGNRNDRSQHNHAVTVGSDQQAKGQPRYEWTPWIKRREFKHAGAEGLGNKAGSQNEEMERKRKAEVEIEEPVNDQQAEDKDLVEARIASQVQTLPECLTLPLQINPSKCARFTEENAFPALDAPLTASLRINLHKRNDQSQCALKQVR